MLIHNHRHLFTLLKGGHRQANNNSITHGRSGWELLAQRIAPVERQQAERITGALLLQTLSASGYRHQRLLQALQRDGASQTVSPLQLPQKIHRGRAQRRRINRCRLA
jgi:hypothetical protein